MIKLFMTFCLFLSNVALFSAQYIPMDPTAVISVNLSSNHHNRIGIIGDRIKKAFFRNSNLSVDVEEDSGQLFVQAMKPHCPNTTLSLVSTSGVVQDLELCFFDGSSEIVLLQPVLREIDDSMDGVRTCNSVCEALDDPLTNLVDGVIKGIIPDGYTLFEDQDSPVKICKELKMQRISRLVGDKQIVFFYRLQNISKKSKCVTECQVNILDGDWVFLDRYKLNPDECAIVLIGCLR